MSFSDIFFSSAERNYHRLVNVFFLFKSPFIRDLLFSGIQRVS